VRPLPLVLHQAAIVGAGVANAGSADFRVASDEDFLVQEVRGFLVSNAQDDEPTVGGVGDGSFLAQTGTTLLTPSERAYMKAQNARVTILDKDTKVPYTENEGIGLASITPEVGGMPLKFSPDGVPGFIFLHNKVIRIEVALQSASLIFNTTSTSYGVSFIGCYIKRAA